MSQHAVERTLGNLTTDEEFRARFFENTAAATWEAGRRHRERALKTRSESRRQDKVDLPARLDRDEQLLTALRQGEPTAAERLVTAYGDRAYRLATRITGNGQDGEEVVQDAFLAVVRKIDSFRGDCAFGTWLYRIVANAAFQKLRRRSRCRELSYDDVVLSLDEHERHFLPITDWSPRLNDPSLQIDLRTTLTVAIHELPTVYRTTLVMRDVEGLSNLEVATALGLSVANVKSRVHRARLFLRKRLSEAMAMLDLITPPRAKSSSRTEPWNSSCTGSRTSRCEEKKEIDEALGNEQRGHDDTDLNAGSYR